MAVLLLRSFVVRRRECRVYFLLKMCRNLRHSRRLSGYELRCHQPTQTHFSVNNLWRSSVPPRRSLDVLSYPSNVWHALPEKSVLPHPPAVLIQRQDNIKTPTFLPGQQNVPSQLPIQSAITFQQRLQWLACSIRSAAA